MKNQKAGGVAGGAQDSYPTQRAQKEKQC
nr:hypothetical protein VCHA53O474_250046 [Vibrio chagasii]